MGPAFWFATILLHCLVDKGHDAGQLRFFLKDCDHKFEDSLDWQDSFSAFVNLASGDLPIGVPGTVFPVGAF